MNRPAVDSRVLDRLYKDGRITSQDRALCLDFAGRHGGRVEDALIELEVIGELDLLKYISTLHSTRFVSTEKLYQAKIDPRVVAQVPRKVAEMHLVFPVLYNSKKQALSVVTPDPSNEIAMDEVRLASGVKQVNALVGRPAAVRAAIARGYRKDESEFTALIRPRGGFMDLPPASLDGPPPVREEPSRKTPAPASFPSLAPTPDPSPAPAPVRGSVPGAPPSAPELADLTPPAPAASDPGRMTPLPAEAPPPPPVTSSKEYLETLNVLVSLLDNSRGDLRGHSSVVARLMRTACERLGLKDEQIKHFVVAAHLHDLGKAGAYHLTLLNVAEYDGHRIAAQKVVEVPVRLMESVGLHPDTTTAVLSMYERYDGKGFPAGLASKDIPLGARILSVVDTYADLTQNPRNPYRKTLEPAQACEVLGEYRGKVFDPNVVDLFRQAMTGEDMRAKLLSDRHTVLIVDPDPEETTVLELRLIERGFDVKVARTGEAAMVELQKGGVSLVISEVDLDNPDGGVTLRGNALKEEWGRELVWVILTRKTDREVAQIVFDLGVDDFIAKPASTEILTAKIGQLIERKAARAGSSQQGGVSGSLSEMGLPEVVQILWHGRKTCALKITSKGKRGEIHFQDGQIVNALWGTTKGEDAFYEMLNVTEGDFALDPTFAPTDVVINASPEALLLEGMRRLDEQGGSSPSSDGGGAAFDPFA